MVNHMLGSAKFHVSKFYWVVSACIVFILYRLSFSSYFFQDDWFSLLISKVNDIGGFLQFFSPRADVIYYRPLGMQVPFFLFQTLFGISPIPFRIATFITHFLNGILVYLLIHKITKNTFWAQTSSFLYYTSAVHFTIFFWAATIAFVLAPLMYFGSFYLFLQKKYMVSFCIFLVGLLTNEMIVTLPAVLILYEFLFGKREYKRIVPFFLPIIGYALIRFITKSTISTGAYALSVNLWQLKINIRDYVLWSFNLPEEIHNQFVSFWMMNIPFIKEFFPYILAPIILLSIATFGFIAYIWQLTHKIQSGQKIFNTQNKQLLFGSVWFIIALTPVLFFSQHSFSYYLPISMFGLFMVLFVFFSPMENVGKKVLIWGFIVIWVAASYATIHFNMLIHWAPRRAKIAYELVKNATSGNVVYITKSDENYWALGDQNAFQVIYHDASIQTRYE